MGARHRLTKDHWGGLLMLAAGLAVAAAAASYEIGSLAAMGSGFFPLVLGVLLAAVGAAIALTSPLATAGEEAPSPSPAALIDRRAWACICASLALFAVLGTRGGLVPASFVSVFVAALADRANRLRDALALAAGMTVFGVVVFHYALRVLLPLFSWH